MRRANIRTRRFLLCPACDQGESFYEHLEAGAKTRWHCDHCGVFYDVEIDSEGTALVGLTDERTVPTLDLLVLPPQRCPVYFVINGRRTIPHDTDVQARHRNLYESHSCPTNWLQPELVYCATDDDPADPHGLIRFVRCVDRGNLPEKPDQLDDVFDWTEVFPELTGRPVPIVRQTS